MSAGKKFGYASLNFIAPGIAQFAMKRWIRGLIYLLSTLACLVWIVAIFFQLLIGNLNVVLKGGEPHAPNILVMFIPIGGVVVIWIISYIDLFLTKMPDKVPSSEKDDADSDDELDDIAASDEEKIKREVARQLRELKDEGKIKFTDS